MALGSQQTDQGEMDLQQGEGERSMIVLEEVKFSKNRKTIKWIQ